MRQKPGAPPNTRCKGCPSEFDPCLWSGSGDTPAHLIVVSDNPSGFSIGRQEAFFGPTGRMFQKLLGMVKNYQNGRYEALKVYKTYSVLAGAVDVSAEHVRFCQPHLINEIARVRGVDGREPVIVAIGVTALKALGVRSGKITDVVGRELTAVLPSNGEARTLKVIPVFEMGTVNSTPGYVNVVLAALLRAVKLATGDVADTSTPIETLTKDYSFPQTVEEVGQLVDHVINYFDTNKKVGPQNWLIALDTETNTLHPETHENPRVLMVSVSWDDGKAATILLDHEKTPYDPKEAWKHVERLLRSPKPKAFHNWKFDRKFLESVYKISVNNLVWDTLCGEHYIDEDKKGLYGLKKLTTIYTPDYTGYDEELQTLLRGKEEVDVGVILRTPSEIPKEETAPEGRDQNQWDRLRSVITQKMQEMEKGKSRRDKVIIDQCNKEIAQLYKRLDLKLSQVRENNKKKVDGFEEIPLDTILRYAAIDADVTRMIAKSQLHRLGTTRTLDEGRSVMRQLYLPASNALGDMEFRGFKVNMSYLDTLDRDIGALLWEREKALQDKFGTMNYRSPAQITQLLSKLSFERIPGADGGSTGKDVLDRYVAYYPVGDARRDFAENLLAFRAADKAKSGFLKNLRKLAAADGKIHCSFNLTGTATGRLSSSAPNMQNIPSYMCRIVRKNEKGEEEVKHPGFNIKKLFSPSDEDHYVVNVDIKGAELRVYTAYSHDEKMIKALLDGLDIHSFTASKIYKLPYETVERDRSTNKDLKKKRDIAKRVVFGTFYGAGAFKISEQINSTKEEAQRVIDLLFSEFPALKTYIDTTKERVRSTGFVQTHFGRFRRFKLAHVSREHMAESVREAVNFLIQSTASDLVLSQLCEIADHLDAIQGKLLITVHDSMTFEIPKSTVNLETREVDGKRKLFDTKGDLHNFFDKWIVQRVAEKYDWLPVPFLYDIEIGASYGELKEVSRG